MTCWIISQAMNLCRRSTYVFKGYMYFFVRKHLLSLLLLFELYAYSLICSFHVSNLWLGCFEKQNWFYYKIFNLLRLPKLDTTYVMLLRQIIFIPALMYDYLKVSPLQKYFWNISSARQTLILMTLLASLMKGGLFFLCKFIFI